MSRVSVWSLRRSLKLRKMNHLMLLTQPVSVGEGLRPAPSGSRIYVLPKEEAKKKENTNNSRSHFPRVAQSPSAESKPVCYLRAMAASS